MSPARIRYGAEAGIEKVWYWGPTSRWRSERIWKDGLGGKVRNERSLFIAGLDGG